MNTTGFVPLLWFLAIVAMIPIALWLLKRTPIGGAGGQGVMRSIAVLPLSPSQRLLTVEVGSGDQRQWLVLGVTPSSITTLHAMPPQAEFALRSADAAPSFAQLVAKLRSDKRSGP